MSIISTGPSRSEKRPKRRGRPPSPPSPDASQTISEFCASEKISKGFYFKLRRAGKGPREMVLGSARRISPQARADWRRAREQDIG